MSSPGSLRERLPLRNGIDSLSILDPTCLVSERKFGSNQHRQDEYGDCSVLQRCRRVIRRHVTVVEEVAFRSVMKQWRQKKIGINRFKVVVMTSIVTSDCSHSRGCSVNAKDS
jgi:hypothetical protein